MELELADDKEVVIFIENILGSHYSCPYSPPSIHLCRICHEEEEQSSSTMESPCACSGSLKFAHRQCVQRWCDEKGSTVCEICLQRYETGYSVAPQRLVVDVGVNNRMSIEVPMQDHEPPEVELVLLPQFSSNDVPSIAHSSSVSMKGTFYCRSIYMALATILLMRQLICILALGAQFHASTLFMVFVLRASGIILPIFVIMKATMMVIQGLKSKR